MSRTVEHGQTVEERERLKTRFKRVQFKAEMLWGSAFDRVATGQAKFRKAVVQTSSSSSSAATTGIEVLHAVAEALS